MKTFCCSMILSFCFLVNAGENAAFWQKGAQLAGKKKFSEAAKVYHELAAREKGKPGTIALFQEILCLGNAKKLNEALAASEKIQNPADRAYLRMNAYYISHKYREILKEFDQTDIGSWPEKYAYLGWEMRGLAFYLTNRNMKRALADLKKADEDAGSDFWNRLLIENGIFFVQKALNDRKAALQTADAIFSNPWIVKSYFNNSFFLLPMIESIRMMTEEKNIKGARKRAAQLAPGCKSAYYACLLQECSGDIEIADGNADAAGVCYKKALKNKHPYNWKECEKRIQAKLRKINSGSDR